MEPTDHASPRAPLDPEQEGYRVFTTSTDSSPGQETATTIHPADGAERALPGVCGTGHTKRATDDVPVDTFQTTLRDVPLADASSSTSPSLSFLYRVSKLCVSPNTENVAQCSYHHSLAHGFRMITFSGARLVVHVSRMLASIYELDSGMRVRIDGDQTEAACTWNVHWWEPGLRDSVSDEEDSRKAKADSAAPVVHKETTRPLRLSSLLHNIGWCAHSTYKITVADEHTVKLVSPRGWSISVASSDAVTVDVVADAVDSSLRLSIPRGVILEM